MVTFFLTTHPPQLRYVKYELPLIELKNVPGHLYNYRGPCNSCIWGKRKSVNCKIMKYKDCSVLLMKSDVSKSTFLLTKSLLKYCVLLSKICIDFAKFNVFYCFWEIYALKSKKLTSLKNPWNANPWSTTSWIARTPVVGFEIWTRNSRRPWIHKDVSTEH